MPLTPALHRRLQKYIAQYRPRDARSDRIFLAMRKSSDCEYEPLTGSRVNQLLTTLTAMVGIKKRVYPHLLRQSFGTYCLRGGA